MAFFFFGTLMDPDVLGSVLGRALDRRELAAARLPGFRCVKARFGPYPVLVPRSEAEVDGCLLPAPGPRDERRIIWFEEDEYAPVWQTVKVTATGHRRRARVFLSGDLLGATAEPWVFERWAEREKVDYLRQCETWMQDCPV